MSRPLRAPTAAEPFAEKDFYLEEFRGRSVLLAIAPAVAKTRPDLAGLASAVGDLVRNDTRVLLWWPLLTPGSERRLLAALGRAKALPRRAGTRRRLRPVLRVDAAELDDLPALRAGLWGHLRSSKLCVLAVRGGKGFPAHPARLAAALRMSKLVLVSSGGGLEVGAGRLSFCDENVLETILRDGQAEWAGLGDRRPLLEVVQSALAGGVDAVNLCTIDGVAEELFTYVGSGTLVTRDDYCTVAPLGLDQFAQAEQLMERGQREGMLKVRDPDEIAAVLAAGYGARVGGRSLAGVAGLLETPYVASRAAEIVGLYTITRFKGEGVGEKLVRRLVEDATARNLKYVFACAVDEHAQIFFERLGFDRVRADEVPKAKWVGYDKRRRARVAVFKRRLGKTAR